MTRLPPGDTLCRPATPGQRCHNCRRAADHPEQVLGMVTRVVNTTSPRDQACIHVPISLTKRQK